MTPACGSGKCRHSVANGVLYRIYLDMLAGTVPVTVASFAALHDHVDANMYFVEVAGDVPACENDEECLGCELRRDDYFELVNAAQDLAAMVVDHGAVQRRAIAQLQ